jgi:DNA mismatch repair ATPase MutL
MPIAQLPPNTVCTISSSQVLTDSCSLVKELIDNSLDAEAAVIFVEVSLNALDIIQVRDNGLGITPDDRRLLCNRHCTSKIRGLADLETIGGQSLGFRGEALASAAELSGSIVVSTRVEGEATAVSLTIGRKGEIQK